MLVLDDWPGVKLTGETKFECPRFSYSEKVEEGDGFVEEIKLLPAGDLQVGGNRIYCVQNYLEQYNSLNASKMDLFEGRQKI